MKTSDDGPAPAGRPRTNAKKEEKKRKEETEERSKRKGGPAAGGQKQTQKEANEGARSRKEGKRKERKTKYPKPQFIKTKPIFDAVFVFFFVLEIF